MLNGTAAPQSSRWARLLRRTYGEAAPASAWLFFKAPGKQRVAPRTDDIWHTCCYRGCVALFRWNEQKNRTLQEKRGIGFSQIVVALESGGLLDDYPHPNSAQYPNQWVMVVAYLDYAHLAPYVVESPDQIFLKTVIPSRKATRDYVDGLDTREDMDHE